MVHINKLANALKRPSSLGLLVPALLAAFGGALYLQVDANRRASAEEATDARHAAAALTAAHAEAAIANAWGAISAAGTLADAAGLWASDPGRIAAIAGDNPVLAGAVVLRANGELVAGGDARLAPAAKAALRAAKGGVEWAGVAVMEDERAPVMLRRFGGYVIVGVIAPERLLPQGAGLRAAVTDTHGLILTAGEKQAIGLNVQDYLGVRPGADEGRLGKAQEGRTLAVGAAEIPTANLQIYSAGPTRSPLEEVMRAILADLVLALAPLLAVGALLMMLRRHVQRAEVAEEEVERVEERFRIASATARAGFFEWRLDEGDRLAISEPLSSLLRQPRNEATISQILEIIPPDERVQIDQAFSRARETGALDISFRAASGHSVVWIEMRGFDISEDGEHARMIGTARDISARREAEMRATTLQRRLREAIDGFSGPFALWDSRRRLIVWNRSFQSLFKLEPAVLRAGASYDSVWMAAAKQIRRERTDPSDSQSREIELANGDWLRIQERRTAEGGLLAIGIDVTPIKKQEEALKERESTLRAAVEKLERSEGRNKELARSFEEQKHRAEAASRAKSEFLANMSHELRTPLNAIIGFSEIMAGQMFGKLGDDRYASYAKDIHASGELLLELISDVLDMAKIEAGKHNLAPRLLDPMDAIEQAVRLVKRRAEEKGLQVLVDAPEDLPEIEADLRAVKQVLLNLLSNGVKFTDKGGVMIEARAAEDGGGVVFRVIDTGKGIAAEDLPRLARPFEQVADHSEKARDHQGTGLGLALTKSLVEMHGGRIDISSQLGKGTVVTIFLPLKFRGGDSATAVAAE